MVKRKGNLHRPTSVRQVKEKSESSAIEGALIGVSFSKGKRERRLLPRGERGGSTLKAREGKGQEEPSEGSLGFIGKKRYFPPKVCVLEKKKKLTSTTANRKRSV